jgi:hypothetical protein
MRADWSSLIRGPRNPLCCSRKYARCDVRGGLVAARCPERSTSSASAFSSTRPAIDGTQISARALFAPAALTPQNLTSGRRFWRPHQNSSCPRSLGSMGRNQSLSRHLSARTLCGPPAEFARGLEFPRAKASFCVLRSASGGFHRSSLWDFALGYTAPKSDQKLSG